MKINITILIIYIISIIGLCWFNKKAVEYCASEQYIYEQYDTEQYDKLYEKVVEEIGAYLYMYDTIYVNIESTNCKIYLDSDLNIILEECDTVSCSIPTTYTNI